MKALEGSLLAPIILDTNGVNVAMKVRLDMNGKFGVNLDCLVYFCFQSDHPVTNAADVSQRTIADLSCVSNSFFFFKLMSQAAVAFHYGLSANKAIASGSEKICVVII
jgi:hypothetical protein